MKAAAAGLNDSLDSEDDDGIPDTDVEDGGSAVNGDTAQCEVIAAQECGQTNKWWGMPGVLIFSG